MAVMEEAVSLFTPFKDVTAIVSAEKSVTISLIHPLKTRLEEHLNSIKLTKSVVKAAKLAMLDDLSSRYFTSFYL